MKRVLAFISKWWSLAILGLTVLAGIWASLHRKRAATHVAKAREAKRDDLGKAKIEQAKATVSAARADEILTTSRVTLDNLESHDDQTVADRARILNKRMRDATRSGS